MTTSEHQPNRSDAGTSRKRTGASTELAGAGSVSGGRSEDAGSPVPHINWGPGPVVVFKRESLGERWCFRCRRRVEFVQLAKRYDCDPLEDYYGPWGVIECIPHSHDDGDLFPGQYRMWGPE